MNYTKAKAEVVNFNNNDVVTASSFQGHPECHKFFAREVGCGSNLIKKGYCLNSEKA